MPGEDFIQKFYGPFAGGYITLVSASTTVNGAASSTVQTLVSTANMQPGEKLYFETTAAEREILTVDSSTQVTLTATISTTNGETVNKRHYITNPEDVGVIRVAGAPNSRINFVAPDDLTAVQGKMWMIVADEGAEPFTVGDVYAPSLNGAGDVTYSTTFGAVILHYTSNGYFHGWMLPVLL